MNRWCRFFATLGLGLAIAGGLTGCFEHSPPQEASYTQNGIQVEKLFVKDGCTVYRFLDGNIRYVYYADCSKSATVSYSENCGKSCERPVVNTSSKEQ
ncbi:DUF4884 domain-containing protein [Xanthomonas phage X1]|nr:DUF4884 domain-containing protein [Xanthomonas phage X1]